MKKAFGHHPDHSDKASGPICPNDGIRAFGHSDLYRSPSPNAPDAHSLHRLKAAELSGCSSLEYYKKRSYGFFSREILSSDFFGRGIFRKTGNAERREF